MVPFQLLIIISSPSASPYEQASGNKTHTSVIQDRTLSEIVGVDRTCTQTLLALLKLLQESKVSWDLGSHVEHRVVVSNAENITTSVNGCRRGMLRQEGQCARRSS